MQSYGPVITGRNATLHVLGDDVKADSVTQWAMSQGRQLPVRSSEECSLAIVSSQSEQQESDCIEGRHIHDVWLRGGGRRRTVLEGVALAREVVACNDMAEFVIVQ